jgi:hypothetical protein
MATRARFTTFFLHDQERSTPNGRAWNHIHRWRRAGPIPGAHPQRAASVRGAREIDLILETDQVIMDAQTAMPCGLAANQLAPQRQRARRVTFEVARQRN